MALSRGLRQSNGSTIGSSESFRTKRYCKLSLILKKKTTTFVASFRRNWLRYVLFQKSIGKRFYTIVSSGHFGPKIKSKILLRFIFYARTLAQKFKLDGQTNNNYSSIYKWDSPPNPSTPFWRTKVGKRGPRSTQIPHHRIDPFMGKKTAREVEARRECTMFSG